MTMVAINHSAKPGAVQEFNTTNIVAVFNHVGNAYFNNLGYIVIGDAKFGNLPNSGAGQLRGFKSIDIVGDTALSGTITAFIFQNSTLPKMEFQNGSMMSSVYTYESNSEVTPLANTTYKGVLMRNYQIRIVLIPSNSTASNIISYSQYGVVFRYNNALFFCSDASQATCSSASIYLINLLSSG